MNITKDTELYGSFSINPGNNGCYIFNKCFEYYKMNAIYKSFKVLNLIEAIKAAKCLGFKGFAISMPYKIDIIQYLDFKDENVIKTNSCNTVIIIDEYLYGYNTDYDSIKNYLLNNSIKNDFYILGNGGYSNSLKAVCYDLNIKYNIVTRINWNIIDNIKNSTIFNCTPVENIKVHESNVFIDCISTTYTGKKLATFQAAKQFELYTNKIFPWELFI